VLWIVDVHHDKKISDALEVILLAAVVLPYIALVRAKIDGDVFWPWGRWKK
jgi:hypothetical protein